MIDSVEDELRERGGVLSAARVESLCAERGTSVEPLMLSLLPVAESFAAVPISSFRVGAVALGRPSDGRAVGALYLGANVEFGGQALGFSVHAEQSAVVNAWQQGEHGLMAIATSAAPCGHCRQFLHEIVDGSELRVLQPSAPRMNANVTATAETDSDAAVRLSDLLPHAFSARDLGLDGGLMDERFEDLTVGLTDDDIVVQAALDAARRSYVPYTGGRAGCALLTADGHVFAGRYAESAAYNPSISPLESAVAFMVMNSPAGSSAEVVRAVLVECPSRTSQRGVSEALLSSFAPGVPLEVHAAIAA